MPPPTPPPGATPPPAAHPTAPATSKPNPGGHAATGRTTGPGSGQRAAEAALAAFLPRGGALTAITMGHINGTWRVDAAATAERFVLQRLNPIFDAKVNLDIEALTQVLAARGLTTPRLVRTLDGAAWHQDSAGQVWRLLTYVDGEALVAADAPPTCFAAGALLGRFHRALADVDYTFAARRLGVHDTPRHLKGLVDAVAAGSRHPAYAVVARQSEAVLAAIGQVPDNAQLPSRIVHGDPKLSNVLFAPLAGAPATSGPGGGTGQRGPGAGPDPVKAQPPRQAVAWVDLDTLAPMPIHLELGDALRSWCNPAGEGPRPAEFRLDFLTAALRGYAEGAAGLLTAAEQAALLPGVRQITLELCARFLRDALEERYFGWDAGRYAHAWQHHLVRAQSQWDAFVALQALGERPEAEVARAFGLTGRAAE